MGSGAVMHCCSSRRVSHVRQLLAGFVAFLASKRNMRLEHSRCTALHSHAACLCVCTVTTRCCSPGLRCKCVGSRGCLWPGAHPPCAMLLAVEQDHHAGQRTLRCNTPCCTPPHQSWSWAQQPWKAGMAEPATVREGRVRRQRQQAWRQQRQASDRPCLCSCSVDCLQTPTQRRASLEGCCCELLVSGRQQ